MRAEQLASLETQGLEALKARGLADPEDEDLTEGDGNPLPDATPNMDLFGGSQSVRDSAL